MTERTPLEFSRQQASRRKGNTAGDGEKRRVTLPPGVLAQIKSITSDASLAPHRRLEGAILPTWGWAWYERQVEVDPTMIALPEKQWQEVCEYLASGVPDDKISQVNLGLSWMNSGLVPAAMLTERDILLHLSSRCCLRYHCRIA